MPTARLAPLPSFLIPGAAKAGTTTLYELLRQHPQVFLPFDKEPMFFSRDDYYGRGREWYENTFFSNSAHFPARGEATPHYLYWASKVAPRIRQVYGHTPVKFIVLFRNPIDRAHSWYSNMVREGQESLPFAKALQAEDHRLQEHWDDLQRQGSMRFGYFRGGCYASQLGEFLGRSPRERFLFVLLEDLQNDLAATMRAICAFLEIDPDFNFSRRKSNPASMPRSRRMHDALRGPSTAKRLLKRILPPSPRYRLRTFLMALNLQGAEVEEIDPDMRQQLRQRYAVEIADLSEMIGRDLSHWT